MMGLPCVSEQPSSLLWTQELTHKAQWMFERGRRALSEGQFHLVGALHSDAKMLEKQGDRGGAAAVLIAASDLARAAGKLGPALKYSSQAESMLSRWSDGRLRYNYALALYSVGLINQLLGLDEEACDCYDRALDTFEYAEGYWRLQHDGSEWAERCKCMIDWIQKSADYLYRTLSVGGSGAVQSFSLLSSWPLFLDPAESSEMTIEAEVRAVAMDLRLRVGSAVHVLYNLQGERLDQFLLDPEGKYFILKAPPDPPPALDRLQPTTYVLVRRSDGPPAQRQGLGVAIRGKDEDQEIAWGEFEVDPDAGIQFKVQHERDPLPTPRIIGADDLEDEITGTIAGIFRKAA